jgi:hypothetical protein
MGFPGGHQLTSATIAHMLQWEAEDGLGTRVPRGDGETWVV